MPVMLWFWLGTVTALKIVSFSCDGPERSNQPTFHLKVTVDEPIKSANSNAITIVKGTSLQTRAGLPPNLDFETPVSVSLSGFSLDSQNRTFTFSAMASTSGATEVPFLLQIRPGSLQTLSGSAGPDAVASVLLIYDTKAPNPNVSSMVGAYSNKDNFTFDIIFGERVPSFAMQNIQVSPAPGVTFATPILATVNASLGQFLLTLSNVSGEGLVNVTVTPVADEAGNVNERRKSASVVRDVTPAIVNLTSPSGNFVVGDSFGVGITWSEPVLEFDDKAIVITIAQGSGAAGHTPLQSHSNDNTSFGLDVTSITTSAPNPRGVNLTVSLQVKEGGVTDRAGNVSPLKDNAGRVLLVVVDVRGQSSTITIPSSPPTPAGEQKVGSITLNALIGIVVALAVLLLLCALCVCWKKRKEANEAPDAFKRYGRLVYAEYGVPPTHAGLTLEQIVQYGVDNGYEESRSRVAAQRLLKDADTNGDGLLSSDEFVAWLAKVIHAQNKAKTPTPQGQDRRVTHKDVVTLKKVFPLKSTQKRNNAAKKPAKVGVSPSIPLVQHHEVHAETHEGEPMLPKDQQPVSVHV